MRVVLVPIAIGTARTDMHFARTDIDSERTDMNTIQKLWEHPPEFSRTHLYTKIYYPWVSFLWI